MFTRYLPQQSSSEGILYSFKTVKQSSSSIEYHRSQNYWICRLKCGTSKTSPISVKSFKEDQIYDDSHEFPSYNQKTQFGSTLKSDKFFTLPEFQFENEDEDEDEDAYSNKEKQAKSRKGFITKKFSVDYQDNNQDYLAAESQAKEKRYKSEKQQTVEFGEQNRGYNNNNYLQIDEDQGEEAFQNYMRSINYWLRHARAVRNIYRIMRNNWGYLDGVSISAAAANLGYKVRDNKSKKYNVQRIINVYNMILELIEDKIEILKMNELTSCVWSLGVIADIKIIRKELENYDIIYQKLCDQTIQLNNIESTQLGSMVLWSMAKYKYQNIKNIKKIINQILKFEVEEFSPIGISSILWSTSLLKINDVEIIQKLIQIAKIKLEQMKPKSFCNILQSLKIFGFYDQEILDLSAQIIKSRTLNFQRVGINIILSSFLELNIFNKYYKNNSLSYYDQNQQVLDILFQEFLDGQGGRITIFANCIYDFAALGYPAQKLQQMVNLMEEILIQNQDLERYQYTEHYNPFTTLRKAQIIYESQGQQLNLVFSERLQQLAVENMQSTVKKRFSYTNPWVEEMAQFLKQYFDDVLVGVAAYEGQVSIQVQIQNNDKKACLMGLQGSSQYMLSHPELLRGSTIVWINVIENLGWKVIVLTEEKWTFMEQEQKLQLVKQIEQFFV